MNLIQYDYWNQFELYRKLKVFTDKGKDLFWKYYEVQTLGLGK